MNRQDFIEKTPFLYHLTDQRNLIFIRKKKRLFSTTELIALSDCENKEGFIQDRRGEHTEIRVDGNLIWIRDQRPLNKALDKCLTDGWSREDFIKHLNLRVFMWPNIGRLSIHFGRYQSENPAILRFKTSDVLELNGDNVELSNINSGATRPSGTLGGKAAARGKDTFQKIEDCEYSVRKVAEVTFPETCVLPDSFEIGYNPDGPWDAFHLNGI